MNYKTVLLATTLVMTFSHAKVSFLDFDNVCDKTESKSCPNNPKQIAIIQKLLNAGKSHKVSVSGKYDQSTKNAIKAFQRSHNLPDTGFVGLQTKIALEQEFRELKAKAAQKNSAKKVASTKTETKKVEPKVVAKKESTKNVQKVADAKKKLELQQKKIAEQKRLAEQKKLAQKKKLAEQKKLAKQKEIAQAKKAKAFALKKEQERKLALKKKLEAKKLAEKKRKLALEKQKKLKLAQEKKAKALALKKEKERKLALKKKLEAKKLAEKKRKLELEKQKKLKLAQEKKKKEALALALKKKKEALAKKKREQKARMASAGGSTQKFEEFRRAVNLRKSYRVFKDYSLLKKANGRNTTVKISVKDQRVNLLVNGKVALCAPCTTGSKHKLEPNTGTYRDKHTPYGTFKIMEKIPVKRSNIFGEIYVNGKVVYKGDRRKYTGPKGTYVGHPLKNWMRLTSGGIGLHASKYVKRYPGSNGCVRLPKEVSQIIFSKVSKGTKVVVTNN